jgi:hypothetical protein
VLTYAALGLASATLFLARRARPAALAFVVATLLGAAIYALDYRMRFNQTTMLAWVVVAFALAPRRIPATQLLVALFYFWAGTLKMNREWTSGAALYGEPLFVPRALVPAACVYVLVLELALVWGLFAPWARVRWAVYAQLLFFHLASWPIVGWFYPLLMTGLTAVFPLAWLRAPGESPTWPRLVADRGALAAGAAFSAMQLVPLFFPGDTALTGEGRVFALHMFDAQVTCEGGATLRSSAGPRSRVSLVNAGLDARTRCDPIVLVAEARRVCRLLEGRPDRVRVDVAVDAKRATDAAMRPLVRIDDACARDVGYSPWRHNEWIVQGDAP